MAICARPRVRLGQLTRNRLPALAQIAGLAAQVHVQPGHKERCATHALIVRDDPYNVNRKTRNIASRPARPSAPTGASLGSRHAFPVRVAACEVATRLVAH